MINFCFDDVASSPTLGYPNLARPGLAPDEFDDTWPRAIPFRMLMYLKHADIGFRVHNIVSAPPGSWYPVALTYHDHEIDYFGLMCDELKNRLRQRDVKILFYYHEGDNPRVMRTITEQYRVANDLPPNCYLFITANSESQDVANFYYFNDHEYFFRYLNHAQRANCATAAARTRRFTALNRTHKWWRASVMADLRHLAVLDDSLWSYNTGCLIDDDESSNPLQLERVPRWKNKLQDFIKQGPYVCDDLDSEQHNDHREVNESLYTNSYCHLVLETHFDVDGSRGTFLTEKTYKCIKYGQPFIIIGPARSLSTLRDQGYRVFDHVLDNSYDRVTNSTERWLYLRRTIHHLSQRDLHDWYLRCLDDVIHNQELFEKRWRGDDLEVLARYVLTQDSHTI